MKTLACKDFGVTCDFVAKGNTHEEVIGKMAGHVRQSHPDMLAEFQSMSKDKLEGMIKEE